MFWRWDWNVWMKAKLISKRDIILALSYCLESDINLRKWVLYLWYLWHYIVEVLNSTSHHDASGSPNTTRDFIKRANETMTYVKCRSYSIYVLPYLLLGPIASRLVSRFRRFGIDSSSRMKERIVHEKRRWTPCRAIWIIQDEAGRKSKSPSLHQHYEWAFIPGHNEK